jgi:protease IV
VVQIGLSKQLLSRGKFAEIYTETRNANEAEDKLMESAIEFIYKGFRDKAAHSRGMPAEMMEEHAQGRIWLGKDACNKGYAYVYVCLCAT